MRCTDIGERQLIRRISSILGGIVSDDCAVIDSGDRYLVATTDMLHREADFPGIMSPWQIGWMTVAVNLSDIAAMGAEPAGVLIAAGIPPRTEVSFVDQIFAGLRDCAEAYGTRILGGDLDSPEELNLAGCALGFVEKDLVLRRSGARPGDLLCTTGDLGAAGAGLHALVQGDQKSPFVLRLLEPRPRMNEGRALAKSKAVTAMMDNSDGLILSLYDLAEASMVGFAVREDAIPVAPGIAEMVGRDRAMDMALSAGGDFELVFTVKPEGIEAAKDACRLAVIGFVVEDGIWMESPGGRRRIEAKGYEHMAPRPP
jgi:thiamine-monophosphate kinase